MDILRHRANVFNNRCINSQLNTKNNTEHTHVRCIFFGENKMKNNQKCAVIGCGNVGATTAYTLMQSGLISELVLIDINKRKAEGEALDLLHSMPFYSPVNIYSGDYCDLIDCGIVIITAGANQKVGESRTDLVKTNAKIFKSIIDSVCKYTTTATIIVVTNPVDVLTYEVLKQSSLPPNRVIGSGTVLDSARLKYLLGNHFGVDPRNVHAFIIGEHGDSELAVWSSANISGIDLDSYCYRCNKYNCDFKKLEQICESVKHSAYRIIEAKGATYYAIADATRRIVSAIIRDEKAILPVSVYPDGKYGLDGICIGLPCIVGKDGIEKVLEIPLSADENEKLMRSARSIKKTIAEIESIPVSIYK